MNNKIKEYLDSANFKFKEVDENGIETELTLSEEIEKLLEDNRKLAELCNKYEEEHNTTFKEWQKDIQANKQAIENIREWRKDKDNYCDGCAPGWCDLLEKLLNILEEK